MRNRLGSRSRWVAVSALILVTLFMVEFQRDWKHGEIKLPVVLTLVPLEDVPPGSIEVTALDWKSTPVSLTLVEGRWTARNIFTKGLRLSLPRRLDQKIDSVRIAVGSRSFVVPMERVRADWLSPSSDSVRVVYDSPPGVSYQRSDIPFFRGIMNWPGDLRVVSGLVLSSAWKSALCILFLALSLLVIPFDSASGTSDAADRSYACRVLLLCSLFGVVYGVIFLSTISYSDTANPRGDAWEYQSLAVNAALGHGISWAGALEPIETYKFRNDTWDSLDYRAFRMSSQGRFYAYRTPGYPVILAGVYTVFGVSPQKAKQMQLLFLVIIAAFLPYLGFVYWRSMGFYGGIIAGLFFLDRWHPIADILYTECLVALTIFLLLLAFYYYERRRTASRVVLVGLASGVAMLIKGDLIFIPLLILLYLGVQAWQTRLSPKNAVVFAVVCLCTIAPWSIFASTQSGQFIVLSTQGKNVLLEGNNEGTWDGGGWHPEYKENPDAFYNRPEIKELPTLLQVARFYLTYPQQIPNVISQKLTWGFSSFPFLRLAVLLMIVHLYAISGSMTSRSRAAKMGRARWPIATYAVVSIILLVALANIPLMFLILCCTVGYVGVKGWLGRFPFPVSFVIVFGNFVLVTLVTFGEPRFISVMDFVFMLTGVTLLIPLLVRVAQGKIVPLPASNVLQPTAVNRNQ